MPNHWETKAIFGLALAIGSRESGAFAAPTSKLTYVRGGDTEDACPDEAALRRAVASRVGYDPFFPWAERTVVAQIDRAPNRRFAGQIRIIDAQGHLLGERRLEAIADCAELVQSVALAISVAIDDLDAARPPAAVAPVVVAPVRAEDPPVAVAPEPSEAPPSPPSLAHRTAIGGRLSAGVLGSLGTAPSAAAGGILGIAVRMGWARVGLEGRADLAAGDTLPSGGRIATSLLAGSVVPCAIIEGAVAPYACAFGSLGRYTASSENVSSPSSASARYVALGGRLGVDVALASFLAAYAQVDAGATLTRHRLELGNAEVYTLPAGSVAFGGGLAARF